VIVEAHPPVRYAGRVYEADKEFFVGTHRAMPPEDTLARIRPHLGHAGITRVADITGLDTAGIPVAVAVRPASGTLAVEAGKGISLAAAFTSAAMEAIERFVAEKDSLDECRATVNEVADRLPGPPERFPLLRYASIAHDRQYAWTRAWNLVDGGEYLVPRELIILPTGNLSGRHSVPWAPSSNGLASGNYLPEAICAALYEVIERDATSCWQKANQNGEPWLVIDPATIDGPTIVDVLETLEGAGVVVQIAWCPTDIGVPTCLAYTSDRRPGVGMFKGYGCHLDPEIAMVRAVTEAVQARTIIVAGARDDIMRPAHEAMRRGQVAWTAGLERNRRLISLSDIANRSTSTFHGDVAVMIERLQRAGFEHVLVRELEASTFESSVARVVVPGLEPYHFPWTAMGERALKFDPAALTR
jgi:ribosomal protein S12 methylthiotransferase accessory factor